MKRIQNLNRQLNIIYEQQLNEDESLEVMLRKSISEEELAVAQYEDRANICDKQGNREVANMLREIAQDERVHIAQLQKAMEILNLQDTEKQEEGQKEAEEFFNLK